MFRKNIIVTGSNTGIGLVATKKFCRDGHHVFMACRSKERAEAAIAEVQKENPKAEVTFMELNLSNLASVRRFAEEFKQKELELHALVNNAGVFFPLAEKQRRTTDDGFEMTMGTNHLGHFLLTHLLLEDLKKTAATKGEARVVNVASSMHDAKLAAMGNRYEVKPIDFDDLMLEKEGAYSGVQSYKNSKAANILFTKVLAKNLEGTGVIVNSLCPGFIPGTNLARHNGCMTRFMLKYFVDGFLKLFKKITRSADEGGASIVFLATGDEVRGKSGGYYTYDKLTETSEETCDESVQTMMWEKSVQLVKLEEPNATS